MPATAAPPSDPREAILPLVPRLRSFARSLAQDHQEADDLVQDALTLALQGWDRFEPGTNLKAWLLTILRNRFLTVRQRAHVRAEIGVDDLSSYGSVAAVQEQRIELSGFRAAFANLGPGHREVLVLYGVRGLSYDEIAAICGCEVGSVKSRMNRARNTLRRLMLEGGPAPTVRRRPPRPADVAAAASFS